MSHKSRSHHAHVLMSGHNPEHSHHHSSHSRGGSAHHAKPCDVLMRQHHYSGGISNVPARYAQGGDISSYMKPRRFAKGGHCYAEGGDVYAEGGNAKEYGEKPLTGQLRKGGRARHHGHKMHRKHHHVGNEVHDEGAEVKDNSVRKEHRRGGRSKRQHHYWGQDVIGRLPLIGGVANRIAGIAGTLDPKKYGGAEYESNTPGRKAADILSTIGDMGGNLALSAYGGGAKKRGGKVHHRKHRQHHAMGGAGKVRKGMMTESGVMKHYDYDR